MRITHGRVGLELHELSAGRGPSLLLLHELYGSSRDWSLETIGWPGPIYGLDFCGHGRSDWLRGGAYLYEMLLGDADAALAQVGIAAVAGRGLGAYVALMLSAGRRDDVSATLLLGGRGLTGGAAIPSFASDVFALYLAPAEALPPEVDPRVHVLEIDVRPTDYAQRFARASRRLLLCEDGKPRPPWWEAVRGCPPAVEVRVSEKEAFEKLFAEVGNAGR